MWGSNLIWFNLQKPCSYFIVLWRLLHFVVLHVCGFHRLTSRKSCSFMAMCKLHSKESNKGMNVIVSPTVQLKRCTERQILFFDCVQVNFLKNDLRYKSSTLTMNSSLKVFSSMKEIRIPHLWLQLCTADTSYTLCEKTIFLNLSNWSIRMKMYINNSIQLYHTKKLKNHQWGHKSKIVKC